MPESSQALVRPDTAATGQALVCDLENVIMTVGLSKTFPGDIHAVESLDLTVAAGEIFGLLGPNGAGKTTTSACSRRAWCPVPVRRVGGVDVVAHPALAKQVIGVVPRPTPSTAPDGLGEPVLSTAAISVSRARARTPGR